MRVNATEQPDFEYPKLMISVNGMIALFTKHGNGVVLCIGGGQYSIGYSYDRWDMSVFKDYTGVLEMSNEN